MPHNPIRVVVGPANYFSHPGSFNHLHDFSLMNNFLARCGSTANAPLLRRKPNFRQRLDFQGQSIFCFVVIAAKAMYSNWRLSPVTIAAW